MIFKILQVIFDKLLSLNIFEFVPLASLTPVVECAIKSLVNPPQPPVKKKILFCPPLVQMSRATDVQPLGRHYLGNVVLTVRNDLYFSS